MSKKISGSEYPLSKIFSSDFDYIIPPYQRPYAWTEDETGELFDDLFDFFKKEKEESYFLGSIVLIKEEGKAHAEVIDGQQRLATLTILIAVLASMRNADKQLLNYIEEVGNEYEGRDRKPRLTLRERDRDFFRKYVQDLKFKELSEIDPKTLENEAQCNIRLNTNLLVSRVQSELSDKDSLKAFITFLVQRCFIVAVSTPTQQSAFRVFSVLNSRGLDLLPTDIIKAEIIGKITASRQKQFTEQWEELEVQTGREGFKDLFGHIRMIYGKVKAKKALLEEFREQVLSDVKSPEHLIEKVLDPYADSYVIAKKQQYISSKNAEQINDLLKWLNRINNSDWLPPAILFLSHNKSDSKSVFLFFQKLERLAAYLFICAENVNQRIERYAKVISALQNNHSLKKPISAIELSDLEKKEFLEKLNGNVYEFIALRRNYLILRLDSFLADGAATYDPSLLTIEHVLPQTISKDSEWLKSWPDDKQRNDWIHRLANLVPLTRRRNSEAQNYDFPKKKKAYFSGYAGVTSYALTTQVLNTAEWTPQIVERRQKDLLQSLAKKWELRNSV